MSRSTAVAATTALPLADLAESWYTELRALHRSPKTLAAYAAGVDGFLAWHGRKYPLAEPLLGAGRSPLTARLRYAALRQFSKWMTEVGEAPADLLTGMKPPKARQPEVDRLTDDELAAMLRACKTGSQFTARRDEAMLRLMAETGLRASEVVGLILADVDVARQVAAVRKAKGGKHRVVPFTPETARALDRYLRLRRRHKLAHTPPLWLPARGRSFGYQGLAKALGERAEQAGVKGFHLHRLRHTMASQWLRRGGSEGGLMAVAGWSDRSMLDRYVADTANDRAIEEARRLGLGLPS